MALTLNAWSSDKGEEIYKKLIPSGKSSATWESKCTLSMKSVINVNEDKTFDINVKAYSSVNCLEGTEYISLSRTGKYKYQAPVYATNTYWNYTYQVSSHQLNLTFSPIKVDSKGTLGSLAEGLLSMYDGCIGTQKVEDKNKNCIKSGVSKTKSRIRLSKMNFITPTKMIGEFNDGVNIEFTLVK